MLVDLSPQDIEVLLTSLEHSKQRVRDAPDTAHDVRQENLQRLDAVAENLREAKRQ